MITGVYRQKEVNPAKAWLRGYLDEKARLESLMRTIDDLSEVCQRATSRLTATRLSGTGSHGGFEGSSIHKTDAEKELQQRVEHIHEYLLVREVMISRLEDSRQKRLLTLRYLEGLSWQQISREMNYSLDRLYELHGYALKMIRILKDATKSH